MTGQNQILMVEDDPEIARLVADLLRREGFEVHVADNAQTMDGQLGRSMPDLMILDLMLPGEDGLAICRRLRQTTDVPILILTAKSDEIDRVLGLEMGADDYLVKPFGPRELLARVRALLRRSQGRVRVQAAGRRYQFDRFVIDIEARIVETGDPPVAVDLTTSEFDLLACFVQRPRRVLSRDQILDFTRGRTADPYDRTVDMQISRVRRKLEALSPGSNLIGTVRNGGYLFTGTVKALTK